MGLEVGLGQLEASNDGFVLLNLALGRFRGTLNLCKALYVIHSLHLCGFKLGLEPLLNLEVFENLILNPLVLCLQLGQFLLNRVEFGRVHRDGLSGRSLLNRRSLELDGGVGLNFDAPHGRCGRRELLVTDDGRHAHTIDHASHHHLFTEGLDFGDKPGVFQLELGPLFLRYAGLWGHVALGLLGHMLV